MKHIIARDIEGRYYIARYDDLGTFVATLYARMTRLQAEELLSYLQTPDRQVEQIGGDLASGSL